VGALVRLYYDSPTRVQPGDALVTRSGQLYLVAEARRQTRGVYIGRQHLSCIVASSDAEVSGQIHRCPKPIVLLGRQQNVFGSCFTERGLGCPRSYTLSTGMTFRITCGSFLLFQDHCGPVFQIDRGIQVAVALKPTCGPVAPKHPLTERQFGRLLPATPRAGLGRREEPIGLDHLAAVP
jgi:hypothetical protein